MLKAVLFDLDHTLIDWDYAEPWESYQLRRIRSLFEFVNRELYALPHSSGDMMFETFVAALTAAWKRGAQTYVAPDIALVLAETLLACGVPDDCIDMDAVLHAYDWSAQEGIRAYPDVVDVLPQLQASGLALGIVTNASHPMSMRDCELEAAGLLDLFPTCRVAAVDIGYIKPHRKIFEHALALLDIRPDEAVFVGDNPEADVSGAQGVGMYGVLRVNNTDAPETAGDVIPDGTIHTLHELLPLLDGWYPGWRNGHTP